MEIASMVYKKWRHATDPKKEGVTGLEISVFLDRLMDGFDCSDGLEWFRTGWTNLFLLEASLFGSNS
jgi:hypothetical protein